MNNQETETKPEKAEDSQRESDSVQRLVSPLSKKMRYAFNVVLSEAENARCENLHHKTKDQHDSDQLCPVEYNIQRQVNLIRDFIG